MFADGQNLDAPDVGPFASPDPSNGNQKEDMSDPLVRGRHVWKKGRLEFMGGPIVFDQGHGIPGYEANERKVMYPPLGIFQDPVARDLGVDVTEQ